MDQGAPGSMVAVDAVGDEVERKCLVVQKVVEVEVDQVLVASQNPMDTNQIRTLVIAVQVGHTQMGLGTHRPAIRSLSRVSLGFKNNTDMDRRALRAHK